MRSVAVIIAAYDCPDYIIDCVQSIKAQNIPTGWEIDIRIGVDGCPKTADNLRRHKIPFYMSDKNYGAYLIRNSLIYLHPADTYAYFDADDVMRQGYISATLAAIDAGAHAVMTAKIQCDDHMRPRPGNAARIESGGAITFTHYALEQVGGFYRHRCAGDTDFMHRLRMAGIAIHEITEPLYYRRRHNKSLTRSGITRYGGEYRKKVWAEMTAARERGIIKIVPTLVPLREVKP